MSLKQGKVATIFIVLVFLFGILLACNPPPVFAQGDTITWEGTAGDGYWHTPGNWEGGKVPGDGDTAVLGATSIVECVYNVSGVTLKCEGKLRVSGGTFSLAGESELKGDNWRLDGDGTIEISGSGSKLTWSGLGNIGLPGDTGKMVVGEGSELLIEKAGQAILKLPVENNGHLTISKAVTKVFMYKGYTQANTGTLTFEIGKNGDNAVFGTMNIVQEQALALDGELHVNLVDGYLPDAGKKIEVIIYPTSVKRTGTFAEITSSVISRRFTPEYSNLHVELITEVVITAAPIPSLEPGTYGSSVNVALFSETEGAAIYYTTDGSDPTSNSTLYTAPIAVATDMTIKAIAVQVGLPDSPVVTLAYVIENDFAGGDGTEENPYEVATPGQLNKVRYYPYACFKQVTDINLNESPYNEGWLPIGGYVHAEDAFCGIFDGQEYTISNLFINRVAESEEAPEEDISLFGYIEGAEIRNVTLRDVDVTGDSYVGSLVGYARDSLIENCSAAGEVRGTGYCIGGLVGCNDGEDSQITGSYSTCTVSGEIEVGGLAGGNAGQIDNSYAQGEVTAGAHVGGLVGYNYNGAITSCFAECTVTGNNVGELKSYGVGGLVGNTYGNSLTCQIADCYANGTVIGENSVGGLAGYSGNAIVNSYATGC